MTSISVTSNRKTEIMEYYVITILISTILYLLLMRLMLRKRTKEVRRAYTAMLIIDALMLLLFPWGFRFAISIEQIVFIIVLLMIVNVVLGLTLVRFKTYKQRSDDLEKIRHLGKFM